MVLQNKEKKSKKNLIVIFIVLGVVLLTAVIVAAVSAVNSASSLAAYKSQFTQVNGVNTTFQTVYSKYFNEPTSTTRTKADWDTYYTGLSTQIQTLTTTASTLTYSDQRLLKAQQNLQKTLGDFASYITLSNSNIDMQFQVTGDQSTITSDKSISAEEAGFGSGYVKANQTKLDSDNAVLTADQQTYKQQSDELVTLAGNVGTDNANLKAAILAAQPAS